MVYKHHLGDGRHWFGWALSALLITLAVYFAYSNPIASRTISPIIKGLALFGIVFVVEVIVDIIKHHTELQ